AKLAHKGMSIAALELAVRKGLRPMGDYRQALLEGGVSNLDTDTLVQLLRRKMDDDKAIAARKVEAAVKAATKGITLPEIERAARLGLVSVAYYRSALARAGMPSEDQDVMVRLLETD